MLCRLIAVAPVEVWEPPRSTALVARVLAIAVGIGARDVAVTAGVCGNGARDTRDVRHAADDAHQAGEVAAIASTETNIDHVSIDEQDADTAASTPVRLTTSTRISEEKTRSGADCQLTGSHFSGCLR